MDISKEKFENTIMKLFEIVSKDGIISYEEGILIMGIKLDLETYMEAVRKAEEDGVLTVEEASELEELKNTIL